MEPCKNTPEALQTLLDRIQPLIEHLYPSEDPQALSMQMITALGMGEDCYIPRPHQSHWNQEDVMLITYADSVLRPNEAPLKTLKRTLDTYLQDAVTMVHLLPFYPSTSDGGFAVSDYNSVDENLGDWQDIQNISANYKVMFDLVMNHCSSEHPWFKAFIAGDEGYEQYFHRLDPKTDLSAVMRPRVTPLLRETHTARGTQYVWCTFGHDQIDLNFANPQVMLEILRIIGLYIEKGAQIFRLDAIGFLWKEIGTSCIHLPETHAAIQLLRALVEYRQPKTILITETNVPKRENLTYFGNANEAHVVYNFSLPPLLINALLTGSSKYLKTWLMSMPPAMLGTTYLNFIASHDGVGLRPAEGLLDEEELQTLIYTIQAFGGKISWRSGFNGEKKAYEMNISLIDALQGTVKGKDEFQLQRMICAHAIALALEGIPAIYIHSFFATTNDYITLEKTQHNRDINRHRWQEHDLTKRLENPESLNVKVLEGIKKLIALRKRHSAFHPNATQFTLHLGDAIFAFWRQSMFRDQSIFVLNNITNQPQKVLLSQLNLIDMDQWVEIITDEPITDIYGELILAPYQTAWISNKW